MAEYTYHSLRDSYNLSSYLVLGPADTRSRDVVDITRQALAGRISFLQLRVKNGDAREITELARRMAQEIADAGQSDRVPLVIDDRVDVAWQCRQMGIKVDGVHIGQDDMVPQLARTLLGPDAIIGLSAKTISEVEAANMLPTGTIDYLGAGPLHPTTTKPDCIVGDATGEPGTLSLQDINRLCTASKYPVVIGGGVKATDIADLAATKAAGWFVVSAIAGAEDPLTATKKLVDSWQAERQERQQ
jgi:thiamine-phosphate diphosphorylase